MKIEIFKEKTPNTTGHIINYQPYVYYLVFTDTEGELNPVIIDLNRDGDELRRDWQEELESQIEGHPMSEGTIYLVEELVHHYWTQSDDTQLIQKLEYRGITVKEKIREDI